MSPPVIWDRDDWDKALREVIGSGLDDVRRALTAYESENMSRADAERRSTETCEGGCQMFGYPWASVRRIVYCWREGIGFYEDLMRWNEKKTWRELNNGK